MKKILIIILMITSFLVLKNEVKAETFIEGKFINGEYITKDKGNMHHYATMQFITTQNNEIVYCLEPFVTFTPNNNYSEIKGDLTSYTKLSKEQKRQIELLSYYGYGYKNRTSEKWYVITQYLIWKTVDKDAIISFTSTLNGQKITKYAEEIKELENDLQNHETIPGYEKKYYANYGEILSIDFLDSLKYEIVSISYSYSHDREGVKLKNVTKNGTISFRKISNYYIDKVKIYDSQNNQDLIKPGNVTNPIYKIDIEVQKGDITLDIKKENNIYTIESDLTNTCYEISNPSIKTQKICTGDENLSFKTDTLPYGEYEIKQVSNGIGYKKDTNIYYVSINKNNEHPTITINNLLIENKIVIIKEACYKDKCQPENAAEFEIRDRNNNLVDILTTESGYASLKVGYGTYQITQIKSQPKYTLVDPYVEKIVDETTSHEKILYNYYIEEEQPSENEPKEILTVTKKEETVSLPEIPPKTSVDINIFNIISDLLSLIRKLIIQLV